MRGQPPKQNNIIINSQERLLRLNNGTITTTTYKSTIERFRKEGFTSLTSIQEKALPVIIRRINCLLVAPTGSGKTEAAVLPVFTMLAHEKGSAGRIRAIYITPLRA